MASHSLPVPFRNTSQHALTQSAARVPSLRTVVIVFVILLILFRWLHLILALEMAAKGQQMQLMTEEIQGGERLNALLLRALAEAESPLRLGEIADTMGYVRGTTVFITHERRLDQDASASEFTMLGPESGEEAPFAPDAAEDALSELFDTLLGTAHSP